MKVNLLLGDDSPRSNYLNLDPLAPPNDPYRKQGSLTNFDEFADDAECDEIIATDILDFFSGKDTDAVATYWLSKLRHGGQIVIGGVDIRSVARAITNGSLTLEAANVLLYGTQDTASTFRKSSTTMRRICDYLESKSLKIMSARIEEHRYIVKGERP